MKSARFESKKILTATKARHLAGVQVRTGIKAGPMGDREFGSQRGGTAGDSEFGSQRHQFG